MKKFVGYFEGFKVYSDPNVEDGVVYLVSALKEEAERLEKKLEPYLSYGMKVQTIIPRKKKKKL